MTPLAVWIALLSAVAVLVGQWATGRLFARLKAIEDRQNEIDEHLKSTDIKVEAINEEGSNRSDKIQTGIGRLEQHHYESNTRLEVLKTRVDRLEHDVERRRTPRQEA